MNSRDAAYDELEMMALLVDSTAEASATVVVQSSPSPVNGSVNGLADIDEQAPSSATVKKKRKRGSEDAFVTFTLGLLASLKPLLSVVLQSNAPDPRRQPPIVQLYPNPRTRRHRQRHPSQFQCLHLQFLLRRVGHAIDVGVVVVVDPLPRRRTRRRWTGMRVSNLICLRSHHSFPKIGGGAQVGPSNRRSGGGRSRASGSRRNPNTGDQAARRPNGSTVSASAPPASYSRTYSSSQQQQQPLLTSWGLPDYLSHLEPTLPSKTPQPLQLRSGEERGVRVRWPGKRMSVSDMNKRVRALVEWVGREQASASERYRRREALKAALGNAASLGVLPLGDAGDMAMDGVLLSQRPPPPALMADEKVTESDIAILGKSTMKMMEELMEELIGFQERFGPGAKSRERRTVVLS